MPGAPQPPPGPFGEQPHRLDRLLLEHGQAGPSGRQSHAAQDPLHGAGRDTTLPGPGQMGRDPAAPPGPRTDRHALHQALGVRSHLYRPTPARLRPAGMQPVDAIALDSAPPPVEQRPGDPNLSADLTDIADLFRPPHDAQAQPLYALVEGHHSLLSRWVPCRDVHSGEDRADGPPPFRSEVSTLMRPWTP